MALNENFKSRKITCTSEVWKSTEPLLQDRDSKMLERSKPYEKGKRENFQSPGAGLFRSTQREFQMLPYKHKYSFQSVMIMSSKTHFYVSIFTNN